MAAQIYPLAPAVTRVHDGWMLLPRPALLLLLLSALPGPGSAGEIVVTDPVYGKINASAIDQPRMYVLVSDPAAGDSLITWNNPDGAANEPALLTAFVDTGASGVAISHLNATGLYDQANLGLDSADFTGDFTETGIGGNEVGDVTRPFGIRVRSGGLATDGEILPAEFDAYGDFKLWVRRETGTGEYNDLLGADPINLIGMPIIRQRRFYLDPRPMEELAGLESQLLAPTATEITTQATIPLILRDFIGDTPPSGEVPPSHYANPLVPGITLREGALTTTGTWLLDTGAGSSFVSFAAAKAIGLIPSGYATLAGFMAGYTGPKAEIGGIGASQTVPILTLDRISVTSREGAVIVWENVDVLVADVAGLDGIFGMNLLVPSVTIDSGMLAGLTGDGEISGSLTDSLGLLLALLFDISPSPFTGIVIDTTNASDPVMRLATPRASGTAYGWLGAAFSAAERSDPVIGALASDPDGDGLVNLAEYALGLDARVANAAAGPVAKKVSAGGGDYLALSFSRPTGGAAGVAYAVELSNDLATWRRSASEVVLHQTLSDGARETLTYRATTPLTAGARLFLRLVVETTP